MLRHQFSPARQAQSKTFVTTLCRGKHIITDTLLHIYMLFLEIYSIDTQAHMKINLYAVLVLLCYW